MSFFDMKISGLLPETIYEIYIVGGSFHPDFPDLMDDGNVIILEADTLEQPVCKIPPLTLQSAMMRSPLP